ncbi:MAG: 4a-hydroxytetrahydrobiopterin dehydratase [Acidimicrobiia bacterium]
MSRDRVRRVLGVDRLTARPTRTTAYTRPMALLDQPARDRFLASHPEWDLDGEVLSRTFGFGDFVEAMGFVTRVALLAEKAFHHPDLDIRWNRVTVRLSTHSEGGLTEKDTDLAAQMDGLA